MKAIISLSLLFLGSVISKRVVTDCTSGDYCPDGFNRIYSGDNLVCLCERLNGPFDPCEKSIGECSSNRLPNCTGIESVCPPQKIIPLCDSPDFYLTDVCDKAGQTLRKNEGKTSPSDTCSESKIYCISGRKEACDSVPGKCDPYTILDLCENRLRKNFLNPQTCGEAKTLKAKLENEKTQYTCKRYATECKKASPLDYWCTALPTVCGSITLSKLCYQGVFNNDGECTKSVSNTLFLSAGEVNEEKCSALIEQCDTGHFDECADIPSFCGKDVVSAMCKKSYSIKNTLKLNRMCVGVDTTPENPGCDTFYQGCLKNRNGCKLAERLCGYQSIAKLCSMNLLDAQNPKCQQALLKFPQKP